MRLESLKYSYGKVVRELLLRRETSDSSLIGQIFVDNCFDITKLRRFNELKAFLARARAQTERRPLIIDAGANIGVAAIYFAAQCQDALIVAIEPEASNFALLCKNVVGLPVLPIPCALAERPKTTAVVDKGAGFWGFQTEDSAPDEAIMNKVSCVTVNEIFEEHQDECFPFIVKIDIEGGEKSLFEDNVEWIEKTPVVIVELHDWMLPREGTARPFLRAIAELDRDFVYIGENIFSISNNLDKMPFLS